MILAETWMCNYPYTELMCCQLGCDLRRAQLRNRTHGLLRPFCVRLITIPQGYCRIHSRRHYLCECGPDVM